MLKNTSLVLIWFLHFNFSSDNRKVKLRLTEDYCKLLITAHS